MVQRKALNKLGIQADHVKSEKGLVSLKPSSSQHQDGKNKGADLKKKMKKSRSFKRSDFESLRSSPPLRKEIPQPGKPPPSHHVPTRAATPQRQSPVKAPEASPNYMKSTSSFEARKERSQVSSRTPQTSTISKSLSPKKSNNLRHNSASGHKIVGTLTRTSSLKLVRTLTKTPSFKPARASVKKYSPVVLCENLEVQKPTCSSTLKDSKFPAYLTLSPGATESEGTSAMKVCPYTYCSLNGQNHAPVPPLKGFLSAKRRMMKAQKIIKLGCLSPRRAKPSGDSIIATDAGPVIEEIDSNSSPKIPIMQEKQTDFFIEIYGNNRDDTADGKILESLSGTSQCSDIEFEDNLSQHSYSAATDSNNIKLFTEEDQNVEAGEEVYPLSMAQEETQVESFSNQCNSDEEIQPSNQLGLSDSEASEMEWEAGQCYEPSLQDLPIFKMKGTDRHSSYHKSTTKSGDICRNFDDILADEESVSSDAWFNDVDSELDGSYQNMESDESTLVCDEQRRDTIYFACDASELTNTDEKDGSCVSDETLGKESNWVPIKDPEEFKATSEEISDMDLQLGVDDTKCTTELEEEALFDHQENEYTQDEYANTSMGNQDSISFHDSTEQDQDETNDDYNKSHDNVEVCQFDSTSESSLSNETSDDSLLANTEDAEADQEDHEQEIATDDPRDRMEEKEQLLDAKSFAGIRTSKLLEDNEPEIPATDEHSQEEMDENNDESKLTDVSIESETIQTSVDDTLPDEIQDQSSKKKAQSSDVENQDCPQINEDGAKNHKITYIKYSEDQTHSGIARLRSTEKRDQEADTMEGEYASNSDVEETCSTAKDGSTTEAREQLARVHSNSKEEMPEACKNPCWTIRSKRPVENLEETRNFNPREPNYLPVEPDPEAEKVDLRHQMMDERKNAEEWMVDYALRQAVTKLAPARKRKVALLVEAFEKVLPTPKYEAHLRHTSAAFVHSRTVQACS